MTGCTIDWMRDWLDARLAGCTIGWMHDWLDERLTTIILDFRLHKKHRRLGCGMHPCGNALESADFPGETLSGSAQLDSRDFGVTVAGRPQLHYKRKSPWLPYVLAS